MPKYIDTETYTAFKFFAYCTFVSWDSFQFFDLKTFHQIASPGPITGDEILRFFLLQIFDEIFLFASPGSRSEILS